MTETATPRILHLSEKVISQVHSSKHISSLQGVVFSLLENSLDAGSDKIEVSVDWIRGGCTVKDNGHGILPAEFKPDGGLARKYCTSKRLPNGDNWASRSDTHGVNGMFLAELASLSMLEITSKAQSSDVTATVRLHHGSVIGRNIGTPDGGIGLFPQPVEHHGTLVTVSDLFGSMPVRVKQRALAGLEQQKLWHELKRGALALLLAWPSPCAIRIRETNSNSHVVTLTSHRPGNTSELTTKNLSRLSDQNQVFDIRDVLPLVFQSGLASPDTRSGWVPLSASTSALSLKGLICLEPAPTKDCQFISVGIHPYSRNDGHSELYEAIDGVFRSSDFGSAERIDPEIARQSSRGEAGNALGGTGRYRQTRRGVDRFAMYYMQIALPSNHGYGTFRDDRLSDTSVVAMVHILEVAITSWLDRNFFRPNKRKRTRSANSASGVNTSTSASNSLAHTKYARRQRPENDGLLWTSAVTSSEMTTHGPRRQSRDNELPYQSRIRTGSAYGQLPVLPLAPTGTAAESSLAQHSHISQVTNLGTGPPSREPPATEAGTVYEANTFPCRKSWVDRNSRVVSPFFPKEYPKVSTGNDVPSSQVSASATSRDDYGSVDENDMIAAEDAENAVVGVERVGESVLRWTDPVSRQTFRIDARTGVSLPLRTGQPPFNEKSGTSDQIGRVAVGNNPPPTTDSLRLVRRLPVSSGNSVAESEQQQGWLPNFLRHWSNPVFSAQSEEPIRTLSHGQSTSIPFTAQECVLHGGSDRGHSITDMEKSGTQISRAALEGVKVIGQVDQKFILCTLEYTMAPTAAESLPEDEPIKGAQTLILVDQHAASERIIVESLLHDYVDNLRNIQKVAQDQPASLQSSMLLDGQIQFSVTPQERDLFKLYHKHFTSWGVWYDVLEPDKSAKASVISERQECRLIVRSLPSVIAERCTHDPRLCIDLMRVEAWALADGTRKPISSSLFETNTQHLAGSEEDPVWLKFVSRCPRGILDMINSRACRSAIMFNDALTIAQCRSLMEELSACTFPFACAHGRISMVPLVQLSSALDTR